MAYNIFLERDGRILRVSYSGRVDIAERGAAAGKALEQSTYDDINRFLLDYRQATCLVGDQPSSEALAQFLADKLRQRNARIAWVVTHGHQLSPRVENLTHDFGVANRRFHDLEAAFAWLEQPDAPEPKPVPEPEMLVQPEAKTGFGSPRRPALALAMEASDQQVPMPPVQFAAIVQLVQELLDVGIEEAAALRLAKRMFEIVRSAPPRQ